MTDYLQNETNYLNHLRVNETEDMHIYETRSTIKKLIVLYSTICQQKIIEKDNKFY